MTLRHDGTYVSQLLPWDDWHAGVHMNGDNVIFWRFYSGGTFARCIREIDHNLDFYAFTESLSETDLAAAMRGRGGQAKCGQRLVEAGTYRTVPNGIHCTLIPDDDGDIVFDWDFVFTDSGLEWLLPESENIDLEFKPVT